MYLHQCVLCWDIHSKAKKSMHIDIVPLQAFWHMLCPKAAGDETAWDLPMWVRPTLNPQDSYLVK